MIFQKKYEVRRNQIGFLYRKNVLEKTLNAGVYKVWDWNNETTFTRLPTATRTVQVNNQEVLTKDNVALRFSYFIFYTVTNGEMFLSQFNASQVYSALLDELDNDSYAALQECDQQIHLISQIFIRNKIAAFDSEELNEKRAELTHFNSEALQNAVAHLGITIQSAQLKDITFPKNIQDLFAKQLESKIRSKADLENARTTVATARALKNAAELIKGDESIRFMQYLETMTKIADKGKHTFVFGYGKMGTTI